MDFRLDESQNKWVGKVNVSSTMGKHDEEDDEEGGYDEDEEDEDANDEGCDNEEEGIKERLQAMEELPNLMLEVLARLKNMDEMVGQGRRVISGGLHLILSDIMNICNRVNEVLWKMDADKRE
ncbi:hypothetical protein Syun_023793 [Stephania yunnanensis]|uniref:Uncharacterized protein n=1 Tax=Stephania yunnanensis TaxID=152371 RepID=A0AAP0FDB0_9MAGN